MKEYYFVYKAKKTSRCLPYPNGYTKVTAKNMHDACELFRMVHPDICGTNLNCTCVLTTDEFYSSKLYNKEICQEIISLNYIKQNTTINSTNDYKGNTVIATR